MDQPHPASPARSRKQATFLSRVPVHCITPFRSDAFVSLPNLYSPWHYWVAKPPYPISSRFLYPRPPILLTTPNQNCHATQAIAISTELAWFVALFRFSVRYFCIFSLFSINLFFRSNIILYIFVCGGRGAKRGNFSVLIWILIYSNRTRPGVTQTTLNAWLHLISLLLTIEWLRNISNFYKLLPTTKDKTL